MKGKAGESAPIGGHKSLVIMRIENIRQSHAWGNLNDVNRDRNGVWYPNMHRYRRVNINILFRHVDGNHLCVSRLFIPTI